MDLGGNGPSSLTSKHFARVAVRIAAAVVVAGLVAQSAAFLTESWGRLRAPHDNNYPESLLVWQAMEWADGRHPYQDYRRPPYAEALYGPLAYAPTALAARLTDADRAQTAWIGRGFSLLATIGILLLLTTYLRRHGGGWRAVALVLFLYLSQRKILNFAVCFRPDHQAAFLALAGMMLFAYGEEGNAVRNARGKMWARCLAILCLATAVYTKQDFIAAPLSLALCWLAARRWRDLLAWILPLVLLGLAVFTALNAATGGMYGLNTIECLRSHPYDWPQLIEVLRRDLPESLLAFGVLFAAVLGARRGGRRDLFVWYFWVSLAIHLAALGKKGANINYLLEPLTAGMVPAGIWLAGLFPQAHDGRGESPRPDAQVTATAVGLALPVGVFLLVDALLLFPSLPPAFERREMELQMVEAAARVPAEGLTLVDDSSLAIRLGGRPMLLDIYHWRLMVENNAIDPGALVAALERGKVDCVVYKARAPRALDPGDLGHLFGSKVSEAIVDNYRVERVVTGYVIAIPKP